MKYAVEIAFVIGISVLFLGVVSWHPMRRDQGPSKQAARLQVDVLVEYLESVKREQGDFPTEIQTLSDPWNTPYTYSLENGAPRICSFGPDARAGTGDDICAP